MTAIKSNFKCNDHCTADIVRNPPAQSKRVQWGMISEIMDHQITILLSTPNELNTNQFCKGFRIFSAENGYHKAHKLCQDFSVKVLGSQCLTRWNT